MDEDAEAQAARLRRCKIPEAAAAAAPAGGDPFVTFLASWAEHSTDTRGAFQMRLSAVVLSRLLVAKIPEVSQAQVRPPPLCTSTHVPHNPAHWCKN